MRSVAVIQADIDSTEAAIKAGGVDQSQIDVWNMQIADFKIEIKTAEDHDQAQQQAQQERVQAQTEKVESITLPLDFNDLLDNPLANEMIIEVVKQFQRQAYEEHNAEVSRIHADWTVRIKAEQDSYADLLGRHKKQADYLNEIEVDLETEKNDNYKANEIISQLTLEKNDADTKRDNAVHDLEQANAEITRLNGHVFDLQQQLANAPAPSRAIDIGGNDKLTELAAKAKESTIEKANRGLARWNLPAIEVPSMPAAEAVHEISAAQEEHPKDAESTNTDVHSGGIAPTEGNQAVHELVQSAEETTVTRAEHDALVARVDRIEKHANLPIAV